MLPEEVYLTYIEKHNYDNRDIKYWHYRNLKEIEEDRICKCHDVGNYFYSNLRDYEPKRFFMQMITKENTEPDMNHTITTFKRNGYIYVIEGTWWMIGGIHGPFQNTNAALRWVDRTYKYIWKADIKNPAPSDLEFKFYHFNEDTPTGLDIYEFVKAAKGDEIDITFHPYLKSIFDDEKLVVYFDDDLHSFRALHEICDQHHVSNMIYDGSEIKAKKLIYITLGVDISHLPLPDKLISLNHAMKDAIVVYFQPGNLKDPKLIKQSDGIYDLVWFNEKEDKLHRFKQTAKLLFEEFIE